MTTTKKEEEKPKVKGRSREYLEAALEQARRLLPGWQYAVIHRAAMPSSGGRARNNRRLAALAATAKAWSHGLKAKDMETPELHAMSELLTESVEDHVRKSLDAGGLVGHLGAIKKELASRASDAASFAPVENAIVKMANTGEPPSIPSTLWEVAKVDKPGVVCMLSDTEADQAAILYNPNGLNLEPGDVVEADHYGEILKHSVCVLPNTQAEFDEISSYQQALHKATKSVDFVGPDDAKLVFVSATPSDLELARGEALTGLDGALFASRYLAKMGLKKSDVAVGFAIPVKSDTSDEKISLWSEHLIKSLSRFKNAKVVALGRVAKQALGSLVMDFSLPHPAAVRRHGDRGEVDRKVKAIAKVLDIAPVVVKTDHSSNVEPSHGETGSNLADSISELSSEQERSVKVRKADEEKQIVYGVVLDPYQIDLHGDWLPPAEIESTAHDFLQKSRVIGLNHSGVADATIVESSIEIYPTPNDRVLALQNKPHSVWKRKFGNDRVHSGAWVVGVKLSDELWALHKAGKLNAFSIGGFSLKTTVDRSEMPKVKVIEIG